jgi:pimeloyl-CoA synthetase
MPVLVRGIIMWANGSWWHFSRGFTLFERFRFIQKRKELVDMTTTISVPVHVREYLKDLADRLGVSQQVVLQALVYMTNDPHVWTTLSNVVKAYVRNGDRYGKSGPEVLSTMSGDQDA